MSTVTFSENTSRPIDLLFAPTYGSRDVVMAKGSGMWVTDTQGNTYLDFAAGIAVSLFGHGDKEIADAIATQARVLVHASNYYHTLPTVELASRLTSLSGYPSVFFCNSGTEANEAALKFARAFHWRNKRSEKKTIVCFENGFHGRTMGALSATSNPRYREPFAPLVPGFEFLPLNDASALTRRFEQGDIAAVLIEPVQGEGGVRPCTPQFLGLIRELCTETGALFLLDEIQCSLGRLGANFAFQRFNVVPDLVTIAKPLAAGLPLGAVLVSDRVRATIEPGDHGTTFGGNPVCAAAACVVLSRLERWELAAHVQSLEPVFASILDSLVAEFPKHFCNARGVGFLRAVDTLQPAKAFVDTARAEGLLVLTAGPSTLRFAPPLIATQADLEAFAERLKKAAMRC